MSHVHVFVCLYVSVYMFMYLQVYMFVCLCICACCMMFVHSEREMSGGLGTKERNLHTYAETWKGRKISLILFDPGFMFSRFESSSHPERSSKSAVRFTYI